ncbi:MAG: DUF721 domain-containing protein [Methyloceanibacter sp.]
MGGARPVGAYAAKALDPAARARGFATTALLSEWPAIIGAELAAFTIPDRVVWPRRHQDEEPASPLRRRRDEGATLVLRVEGPRAIEVQHRVGQILERVNLYFGYRAITEMRILQAPVARAAVSCQAPPPPADDDFSLSSSVLIEDDGLREALQRLGSATHRKITGD